MAQKLVSTETRINFNMHTLSHANWWIDQEPGTAFEKHGYPDNIERRAGGQSGREGRDSNWETW